MYTFLQLIRREFLKLKPKVALIVGETGCRVVSRKHCAWAYKAYNYIYDLIQRKKVTQHCQFVALIKKN